MSLYGAAAGQPQGDFFSTADQALFAANGGSINSWVAPAADNVTDRIIKKDDPRAAAEELYLAVLTRQPSEEETAAGGGVPGQPRRRKVGRCAGARLGTIELGRVPI